MDNYPIQPITSNKIDKKDDVLKSLSILSREKSDLFLTFCLSDKLYALEAAKINEIVQLPELSVLEKAPDYIVGLMNLRGKIISVVDPRKLLGIQQTRYTIDNQVLIINCYDKNIGLIIDSVDDVKSFDKSEIQPIPYHLEEQFVNSVYKNENELIAILNMESLVCECCSLDEFKTDSAEKVTSSNYLFPTDAYSKNKLKHRAIKLQKELKLDTNNNFLDENKFVSFSLNNEKYCLNLKHVKEFCKLRNVTLTKVPCVPEFITGIINLRGEFITIIDIKSFLQIPHSKITEKTKIIVVQSKELLIGLLVDEVFNIINIPNELLSHNTPAKFEKNKFTSAEVLMKNIGVMSVFDLEKFLEDERLYIEDAI